MKGGVTDLTRLASQHTHILERVNLQVCKTCGHFYIVTFSENDKRELVPALKELKVEAEEIVMFQKETSEEAEGSVLRTKDSREEEQGCW